MLVKSDRETIGYKGANPLYILHNVYKKKGNNMTLEQIKQFKEENCSKCNKDIDCKITQDINGKLKCTEE